MCLCIKPLHDRMWCHTGGGSKLRSPGRLERSLHGGAGCAGSRQTRSAHLPAATSDRQLLQWAPALHVTDSDHVPLH